MNRKKALIYVEGALPNNLEVIFLINSLNLKHKENNWRKWYDPFGNYISIGKKKTIRILKSDNTNTIKDIYFYSDPKYIISKSIKVFIGLSDEKCFIWLYGIDCMIRYLGISGTEWIRKVPPLNSKASTLCKISYYLMENFFVESDIELEGPNKEIMNTFICSRLDDDKLYHALNKHNKQFAKMILERDSNV